MSNPYVYYRIDDLRSLRRGAPCAVRDLDWRRDLAAIRAFYARLTSTPIDPDQLGPEVGPPAAVMRGDEIVSFAFPLAFREGETEIGGVATVPEQRNRGYCKALIAEMAFRILNSGRAATLTTVRENRPMRAAAEAVGMRPVRHDQEEDTAWKSSGN